MPARSVRARVHAGNFEPLERLDLPEGSEVTLTVDVPAALRQPAAQIVFAEYDVGVKTPFTRDEIYDESD